MSDSSIAGLPSGAPAQAADVVAIQRGPNGGGSSLKLSLANIANYTQAPIAGITFTNETSLVLNHNLNRTPVNIILVDTATPPNQIFGAAIQFTSATQATVSFSSPTSGVAYVS